MKCLVAACLFLSSFSTLACESTLKLDGVVSVDTCSLRSSGCVSAQKAIHDYLDASDDSPSVLTIGLQTSPWRMYDGEMRILTVQDVVTMVRPMLKGEVKRIELQGSWTGMAPDKSGKSLARKLSDALGGFPVSGTDGFMWVAKNGTLRTTHQAFSVRKGSGPYGVRPGGEVMASLVAGWPSDLEDFFVKQGDADGVMRAAAGWDIFYLCPDHALASFERAAKMGNPIAAYNAAVMHLERSGEKDKQAAIVLLSQASKLGDKKSGELLQKLMAGGKKG